MNDDDLDLEDDDNEETEGSEESTAEGQDGGDDGGQADHGQAAAADEEGQRPQGKDADVEPRGGRASRAVLAAKQSAREAEARAQKVEQEMQALRARLAQPVTDPQAEQNRIALMTDAERMEYRVQQHEQATRRQIAVMQFQQKDETDKASFKATVAADKRLGRFAIPVEEKRMEELRKGRDVDRGTILRWMIGDELMKKGPGAAKDQKKAGAAAIKKQTVRPGNGRSDTSTSRSTQSEREARMKRLENAKF